MQHDLPLINRNFNDINPLLYGWENCFKSHSFGPTIRHYFLIHYIVSGKGVFKVANKEYKLSKGWMFLIRPEVVTYYIADSDEPWNYIWIGFDGDKAEKLIDDINAFTDNVLYFPEIESTFMDMKEANDILDYAEVFLCSKIYEFFSKLYSTNNKQNDYSNPSIYVKRAINYIQSNYMNEIKVENIANMLNIDRRYLYRIFKSITHKSPKKYIVDLRLEKASNLLINSSYTPSEISQNVGYKDIFNFSKMFKAKYGVSPLNYRKEMHLT